MSKRASPTAVGAFVLGGIALAVAGVIFLGGGKFFADTEPFVIFFEGSLNGLQVGSRVKLEGVPIGEVTRIRAIVDIDHLLTYTETTIYVDRSRFERRGPRIPDLERRMQMLIEAGIRARLELESLITGQLYVSLDFLPKTRVRLTGIKAPYPEIPSLPTRTQEIQATLQRIVRRFRDFPVEDLVDRIHSTVAGIDRLVNDPQLEEAIANLNATLAETKVAAADAQRLLRNVDARVDPVSDSAVGALDQAQDTLARFGEVTAPGSPTMYQLSAVLQELREASRAIRILATYLEENPNSVVFGRGGGDQ
jgi:paraquat-inducible protein B